MNNEAWINLIVAENGKRFTRVRSKITPSRGRAEGVFEIIQDWVKAQPTKGGFINHVMLIEKDNRKNLPTYFEVVVLIYNNFGEDYGELVWFKDADMAVLYKLAH